MNIREISLDLHRNEKYANRSKERNRKAFQNPNGQKKYHDKRAGGMNPKMRQQNIWKHSSLPSE